MIIKIKPPKGWQNPKDAQMVVNHFKKYGANLELSEDKGIVQYGVFSLPDEVPAEPTKEDDSPEAQEARREIHRVWKVNDLVRMYTWEVVE